MIQTNETREPASNMERLQEGRQEEVAACGAGCGCHADGAAGRRRWVVGALIVLVAGVLVVRAVTKTDETVTQTSASSFADMQSSVVVPSSETSMPVSVPAAQTPLAAVAPAATTAASSETAPTASATGAAPAIPATAPATAEGSQADSQGVVCGEAISSLGDLNQKAKDKDGVFVFLAGKDVDKARAAATVVEQAAATIRERGMSLGLFTVEEGAREYASLVKQVSPPGVIAMIKGRGASTVSGEITEAKLMQAFVAASSGGGGCGSGGCGPVGCK